MRFLLRVIPIFIAVLAALFIFRGSGPSDARRRRRAEGRGNAKAGKLVKDPVCGTYVTARGSITASRDSETFYFCSEDCRQSFIAS